MYLKSAFVIVAVVASHACNMVFAESPPESHRTKYNFNYDWKFLKDNPGEVQGTDFNDASWTSVSCPHTFNDIDTFDNFIRGNHEGESEQWRGTSWYRKHFKLAEADSGKKIFIEFESVRQIADVYINGKHLGTNKTGFIPFGYDLTSHIKFGGADNVIAVRVNNDRPDHFQKGENPLPWNHEHWHPVHGGIYRNAYLYALDKLHVTLPLYDNLKTEGAYVYASKVSKKSAEVTAQAEVQNDYETAQDVSFEATIVDNQGDVVLTVVDEQRIEPGATVKFAETASLSNPHLWYTRHPYLYTIHIAVKVGDEVKDTCNAPLGIRSFDFSKDTGMWLNGEHVKLHGWGQKPTHAWPGLGAALPDWLRDFTYQLMDEAGGNFIRWGHCAGSPAEIAMGDKYGFVTLMPGVCGEGDNQGSAWEVRINAFRDMVVYYRNHPSIFIYEGGNWAVSAEHYEQIIDIIKTFDPQGGRLLGNRRAEVKKKADQYVTMEVGTEGWDREFPNLPIVESEYCRDEGPRRLWDNASPPDFGFKHENLAKNTYKWTSEQYAVLQADHWWNKMGKKAYHCGGANWIFSDGPHGGRNPTEVARASGEVDAVRLPKEAFYALKSMWRPEPQVHVIGHWSYPDKTAKDIFVISNCKEVKLYVNGKLQGADAKPDNGYVFKFPKIEWERGSVKVEGYIDGELLVTQEKKTAGPPVAIKLTPITGPKGWRADGSNVVLIDVEVVDEIGQRCPTDQDRVDFQITGPAVWRGGYNSGKEDSTNHQFLDTECGINRVAVRSTLEAGVVKVKASRAGLSSAQVELATGTVDISGGLTTEMPQVFAQSLGKPEPIPVPTPPLEKAPVLSKQKSELFANFSYTGDGKAILKENLNNGQKVFSDRGFNYSKLPDYLLGAEYVRTPNKDKGYWARDQLQFLAGAEMDLYVAHDDRIPRPEFIAEFIAEDYVDTGDDILINNASHSLFQRTLKANESVIMAGNFDKDATQNSNMYVVFAVHRENEAANNE